MSGRKGSVAALAAIFALAFPTVASASVETITGTLNTHGMTPTDRLNHACDDAKVLLADLDARFGRDLRTSKGAELQIIALRIEAFACQPKKSN
jgi:hypothetical protein